MCGSAKFLLYLVLFPLPQTPDSHIYILGCFWIENTQRSQTVKRYVHCAKLLHSCQSSASAPTAALDSVTPIMAH